MPETFVSNGSPLGLVCSTLLEKITNPTMTENAIDGSSLILKTFQFVNEVDASNVEITFIL